MSMDGDTRASLIERTLAKLADPNMPEDVLAHVASGGSLIELCKMWNVIYHRISRFMYEDAGRRKAYEEALAARDEFFIERIRLELRNLCAVDIRKAYDKDGKLLPPSDWPDELAAAIASVETFEEYDGSGKDREYIGDTQKLKLWDKLKSLELLGKNLKMFIDRHEVTGKVTLEDLVNGSMQPQAPASGTAGAP